MSAKTLMVQGTGSGVGKSIITAALCRWFYKKGLKVAPFKAQNMSLNSFVTAEGGEMGRAQVFQAEACGILPSVEMNPVLLKPSGDNMSQVIVMGKPVAHSNARDYYTKKPKYTEQVRKAFDSLSKAYDLIVLEGAGSPAEINLRDKDFVNMAMAHMADAPVLIVGDIDRGGVFAWMKGTYDLLQQDERDRVAGFLINKFRGDVELLKPGVSMFEDLVHKPVLGVIPFDRDLYVDEEDAIPYFHGSVSNESEDRLNVAILRLPRISNFTDFAPLVYDPSVNVRYVWHPSQVDDPDLLILPGTKNTPGDLEFIKSEGLDKSILQCIERGTVILGICGGFQMMGSQLFDPELLESNAKESRGLDLFKFETTLQAVKITKQVHTRTRNSPVLKENLSIKGYEIHMGQTQFGNDCISLMNDESGAPAPALGITNDKGTLIGSYLHGILDEDEIRENFLNHVRNIRNLPVSKSKFKYQEFRETQMDRLLNTITQPLDMGTICKLTGVSL